MNSIGKILSLYELTSFIQAEINNAFYVPIWVKAELVKLNYYQQSGHCFPDLVEKDEGKIKAQIRATIWNHAYVMIASKFKKITGSTITPGMQLLFQVQVSFSPLYGMSLNILDIDPTFTLGALAYEKQLSIDKLTKASVINLNKEKPIPLLLQNLAIISVESSKGYNDFIQTINEYKDFYTIKHKIFPAVLQGDAAITSQISALNEIKKSYKRFDAVLILRGGGADVGMNCYDNFELAYNVATFPIPVITGIGHSTDNTIVDMVAAANMKTPTEAANFIISKFVTFEQNLNKVKNRIIERCKDLIAEEMYYLDKLSTNIVNQSEDLLEDCFGELNIMYKNIANNITTILIKEDNSILTNINSIKLNSKILINSQNHNLKLFESKQNLLNPENVLKRGFSITYYDGKTVKNANEVPENAEIETILFNGKINSVTKHISKNEQNN
ncbi:MAG: exodeoxyribonuclease VII large subunit [Bacteroidales bacterium]|jgi:exodeoxyribonuclease VII large subunit|nr:exodeoxyribonuclease VII large subunit [Bacteroidales bacterium]